MANNLLDDGLDLADVDIDNPQLSSAERKNKKDFRGIGGYQKSELDLGDGTTIITETRMLSAGKIEGDNITYGNPVMIDASNIDQLKLGDDIVTYFMDKDGNLTLESEYGLGSDFAENNAREFLGQIGMKANGDFSDGTNGEKLMLQRVEVNGVTQGYFVANRPDGKGGFYLGPDAIDFAALDEKMRAELAKPEPKPAAPQPPEQALALNNENRLQNNNFMPAGPIPGGP